MKRLVMVLMALQGWSYNEALDKVIDARLRVIDGADAETILTNEFEVDSRYLDALVG